MFWQGTGGSILLGYGDFCGKGNSDPGSHGSFSPEPCGEHVDKVSDVMPLVSVVAIVMIIGGIVAVNAEKIVSCGVLVLGVVAIHNFCGMMLGFLAAKIFHVEYSRTTAIAIEVGMQNSGLAVSLAAANFAANPLATLPGAIFSVWHNIAGSIFAGIRRAGAERQTEPGAVHWQKKDKKSEEY